MSAANWNIVGSVLTLLGLLILFRYGMPYRVRSDVGEFITTETSSDESLKTDRLYGILGWVGLALAVLGTLCQIAANVPAMVRG